MFRIHRLLGSAGDSFQCYFRLLGHAFQTGSFSAARWRKYPHLRRDERLVALGRWRLVARYEPLLGNPCLRLGATLGCRSRRIPLNHRGWWILAGADSHTVISRPQDQSYSDGHRMDDFTLLIWDTRLGKGDGGCGDTTSYRLVERSILHFDPQDCRTTPCRHPRQESVQGMTTPRTVVRECPTVSW